MTALEVWIDTVRCAGHGRAASACMPATGAPLRTDGPRRHWLLAVVPALLAGCAGLPGAPCLSGQAPMVSESLYLGAATPDGALTVAEWQAFLADTVTPRFPHGFSVVAAEGQWRGPSGELVQEDSRVLTVVHADDAPARRAVDEIAGQYKTRFRQDAVLRVRSAACVSF